MNSKALTLAVVAVVLAVGTFYGLNAVAPQKHQDEAAAAGGPTVDEVFSGTLQLADDAPAAEVPTEDPALAPGPAPGEIAPEPGEEMPADELADDAGSPEPDANSMADEAIPTDIDEAAAADAPEAEAPAPAAVEPPPAPAPAPKAEPKQPAASKPAAAAKPAAPAPATNWWGNGDSPDKLALTYAGSAAYRTAVVLMFNRAFGSADSANSNIKVTDAAGKVVSGSWELNPNNAAMLVFPVQNTGRYTVSIKSGLTDLGKTTLGKNLKGPVTVK
jgi:hypothetical protein